MSKPSPSFFPTHALDHAAAGIGAGVAAVLGMHPLDLLKVKFQVATTKPSGGIGSQILNSLKEIQRVDGWRGLYRGVNANIAGNASSWGLYFLFYNMLKKQASPTGDPSYKFSHSSTLLFSAAASASTAILTNPIWVVKVRLFTTQRNSPEAYRGLWDGLKRTYTSEGLRGLYRGTTLALVGVTNGALQFVAYEQFKWLCFEQKKKRFEREGRTYTVDDDKLSNTTYTLISGLSKVVSLCSTYPYQVIRSRIQNNATAHLYPTIPICIRKTWSEEGVRGLYRGLGTNLVRVLPGTCITFVVYENLAWFFRVMAVRRNERRIASDLI